MGHFCGEIMEIYRAEVGNVIRDETLAVELGWPTEWDDFNDAMKALQFEKASALGDEFDWMPLEIWRGKTTEEFMLTLSNGDYWHLIWYAHLGELLAILRWLVPLAAEAQRIDYAKSGVSANHLHGFERFKALGHFW
jgi:hypothetical protein